MAELYENHVYSTLAAAIGAGDLSLTVSSATGFPTSGTFAIRVDDEIMTVTAVSGTTFTVTRATEAVSGVQAAAAHVSGSGVYIVLTKRSLAAIAAAAGVTDHGALTGLTDDDHPGAAWLAGRSGGQTLVGGTASGEDLTLQSTAHATKGTIFLGSASAYDENNDRLGLGTTGPLSKLHVNAGDIRLAASTAGGSDGILRFYHTTTNKWNVYTYDVGGINRFSWSTGSGVDRLNVLQTGEFSVGTGVNLYTGSYDLTVRSSNAATNTIVNTFAVAGITTGTVAAGYGVAQLFLLESSTTNDTIAGGISCRWGVETHATREGILALYAIDYGGTRTGMEITGNGSATEIGFYGVTPTVRPTAYTQTYSTADKTHANPTAAALTVADGAGTNDGTIGAITADASVIAAVQELADQVNKLVADMADVKQLVNSVIDDLQTLGLLQ